MILVNKIAVFRKQSAAFIFALSVCVLSAIAADTKPITEAGVAKTPFADPLPQHINFQHPLDNKDIALGEVQAFLQDSQGFMWIGGGGGLVRYDGYEFKFVLQTVTRRSHTETIPVKSVNNLFEDTDHILWVLTRTGLLRYDPHTELLTPEPDDATLPKAISESFFYHATQLHSGEIIFSTANGLFIRDKKTHHFSNLSRDPTKQNTLHDNDVKSIYSDGSNTVWLGTLAGLEKLDWDTQKITLIKPYPEKPDARQANTVNAIAANADGTLWLGTSDGLVHFDPVTQTSIRYINNPTDPNSISAKEIAALLIDSTGTLWIASDGGGISVFEKTEQFPQGHFTNQKFEEGRANSLSSNQVRTVYEDRTGDMWIGNYPVGINYFDRSSAAIVTSTHEAANPKSVSHSAILAVREDKKGNLWLGTDGGGLNFFDREKNTFTVYKNDPTNDKSLSANSVLDVFIDADGNIWAGTWGGGISVLNPSTGEFYRMPFDATPTLGISTSNRLNNATVWSIKADREKNIWIGTHSGGVSKYDKNTGIYTHYANNIDDQTSTWAGPIWSIFEDSLDNFWLGTATGLELLDRKTGVFTHIKPDPQDPNSLSNASASFIFEDSKHRLWIGTEAGLNLLNADKKSFTIYTKANGFTDDNIRTIVEDTEGQLWLSTNNGVSVFDPDTHKVKNYNRDSGRLMGGFHTDSGVLSAKGEIIFGGVEGLRIFNPHKLSENKKVPPVVLTDFKIFTDSIIPGSTDGILTNVINHTDTITLDYTKSMFTFSFSALNFRDAEKNKYAYKLEGYDKEWLNVGNQRTAKYTNLDAGTYIFKVKASNNDGVWNETGKSITIIQLPPPWKTWWAYTLYALTIIAMIALFVHAQRKKLKEARKKIAQERALNERMKSLDAIKENFLANTSHELRTPLNGIIGLAESLSTNYAEMPQEELKHKAKMILRSGKRLANIVNDILEFSQLANNELVLTLSHIPLRNTVTKVIADLQDNIGTKPLTIISNIPEHIVVYSNEHRLTQILHHIVDNAIKFTRTGTIRIFHYQDERFDTINVSDTGVGIAPENVAAIFTAFQQVDGSAKRSAEGAGLGLSVIQKLVELHKGEINVESVVGVGTTFKILLPLAALSTTTTPQHEADVSHVLPNATTTLSCSTRKHQIHTAYFNSHLYADESLVPPFKMTERKYKVLIVDDDAVNRMVVKAFLRKQQYETAEAVDGDDALKIVAEQNDIDLILLDVMMPKMTGYETCEILRKEHSLHKLPIVFLTANHQASEIIHAFSVGATDFLSKPISGKMLIDKVNIHLSLLAQTRQIDECVSAINSRGSHENIKPSSSQSSVLAENSTACEFNVSAQHFLSLQQAVANIVEQAFCLIPQIDTMGCWIQNADNHFECIENVSSLPAVSPHRPLTWQEMEDLTDIVGKENKNISLIKNLTDTASTGRLGKNFVNAWDLYCELIFRDNFIIGFLILGASISEFMRSEDKAIILQTQTHIAAAVTKMKKIQAITSR